MNQKPLKTIVSPQHIVCRTITQGPAVRKTDGARALTTQAFSIPSSGRAAGSHALTHNLPRNGRQRVMAEETPVCGQTDALWFPQMNVAISDFNEKATHVGTQLIWRHIALHGKGRQRITQPTGRWASPSQNSSITHTFSLSLERNRKPSRVLYILKKFIADNL